MVGEGDVQMVRTDDAGPAAVRRARLANAVTERGFLRVTDAALEWAVSSVTIRGDLAALEEAGLVSRVHGGAMPRTGGGTEPSFERSIEREAAAKRAIGVSAAATVESGQSVILDVGSTALAVAHALVDRAELTDVHIVTNGLTIALALEAAMPRFTVIVSGGTLRPLQHSLVNPFASQFLQNLNADLAFIGCNGVEVVRGATNINVPEAEVKQQMVRSAARSVLIADGSKLAQVRLGSIAPLAAFERLITAGVAPEGAVKALEAAGLTVINADRSGPSVF
jgi:DeoR family transcriptional regulator of aga operon